MPAPLPSRPLGVVLGSAAADAPTGPPVVVVEMFLDLCCPFSKKMFDTVVGLPTLPGVEVRMHSVIQPWHAQSSYMHEASLAVHQVAGDEKFYEFCAALFDRQEEFFDSATYDKSRREIYGELEMIADGVGVDIKHELALQGTGNGGNRTTQAVKWATKYHRVRGVHVTPTVFVNGQEAGQVSSGWVQDQWMEFLEPMLGGGDAGR